MSVRLRLIGDVHGRIRSYIGVAKEAEHSIQLGDMGFDYKLLDQLDPDKHKVLAGNHDNYEMVDGVFVKQTKHFLGDFGQYKLPFGDNIFFIRGGYSIDKNYRKVGLNWWAEEELNYKQMNEALDEYSKVKPDFVISHECPESLIPYVSTLAMWEGEPINPSSTSKLLQSMFDIHKPTFWFFGHHHQDWNRKVAGTHFFCLGELSTLDL